jgi:hypothetical protein
MYGSHIETPPFPRMALIIAIHLSLQEHPDSYAPRWITALENLGVTVRIVNLRTTNAIEQVRGCDGVMWHWYHSPDDKQAAPKILNAITYGLNIPVFPDDRTAWHYDEKVAQHYLLDAIAAPKVRSWVFWNLPDALDFIEQCSYPIVFKLSVGAGSANVLRLNTREEARDLAFRMFNRGIFPYTMNEHRIPSRLASTEDVKGLARRAFFAMRYIIFGEYPPLTRYFLPQKNYLYFQEFMPENMHDIRITVIGNRAFGFIRYNREGDFRASGSGNLDYDPAKVPLGAVRVAHEISLKNRFQSMAYDFLTARDGSVLLNEISYCYMSSAVHECPGYWDRDLNWHSGHIWPEEAHVEDFVKELCRRKSQ